jgi:hypothetical protein
MDNQRKLISKLNDDAVNLINKTSRRGYGNSYSIGKLLHDSIFGEKINIIRINKINKLWNRS